MLVDALVDNDYMVQIRGYYVVFEIRHYLKMSKCSDENGQGILLY